jgi:ferritin-like metal-binding protein YciE
MQTTQELFLHELRAMLDGKHRILEILSEQREESSNSSLQKAFQSHHKQTESQIKRLEQCFELIGAEAEQTECAGIKGLREERETMIAEDPTADILDVFNVAAAIKVERYEISSYESLTRLAEQLKQSKLVGLLKRNLTEEEQTLSKMSGFAAKLKPKKLGADESEQRAVAADSRAGSAERTKGAQEGGSGIRIVRKRGTRRSKVA